MLEKVADAIWDELRKPGDPFYWNMEPEAQEKINHLARAAVEAMLMPDEEMIKAGNESDYESASSQSMMDMWIDPAIPYRAMINNVLTRENT
jgi:hypothetical protein